MSLTSDAVQRDRQLFVAHISAATSAPTIPVSPPSAKPAGVLDVVRPTLMATKATPRAQLPVALPDRVEFVVNLKTAKQLGLTAPETVLARVDPVVRRRR